MQQLKLKLLELGKTTTKKEIPDMFTFYEVLAGHNKVSDVDRATTGSLKFKTPSLQTKSTKKEWPFQNMSFNGKTVWRFQTKKRTETSFSTFQNTPVGQQDPEAINWMSPL